MSTAPTSERRKAVFGEIVEQHGEALSRLCGGYEREPAKREELMQEILLALWRSLERFRGDASLRTWTYRVAHNVATRHVHRAVRQPRTSAVSAETEAGARCVERDVEDAERLERLRTAIRELAPLDRQIVLLYLEEIPQADIADITGITTTNVATRIGRIKERLAKRMSARSE